MHLSYGSEGQSYFYEINYPVNIPCGKKLEYPEKAHNFWQTTWFTLVHL